MARGIPPEVLAEAFAGVVLAGRDGGETENILLAGDVDPRIDPQLSAGGVMVHRWHWSMAEPGPPDRSVSPWPPGLRVDAALLALPRVKELQDMCCHALLGCLRPGGRLVVVGATDHGIKSLPARLAPLVEALETVAIKGHARVLAGKRKADDVGLRSRLQDWRHDGEIALPGGRRNWVWWPAAFARGGLDPATALLLAALDADPGQGAALDFSAGTGVIAAAMLQRWPESAVDMLEPDALALHAARHNVPEANALLGNSLEAPGERRYALIVSNPPIHVDNREDHGVLERLVADAPSRLAEHGRLWLVVQRRIPLDRLLAAQFGEVAIRADDGRFRVWAASAAAPPRLRRRAQPSASR